MPAGNNIPTVTRLDRGAFLAVREKPPYALAAKDEKGTVFHGDKLPASRWKDAYEDELTEAAVTNGALYWEWHEFQYGVIFEVCFRDDEQWEALMAAARQRLAGGQGEFDLGLAVDAKLRRSGGGPCGSQPREWRICETDASPSTRT